MLKNLVFSKVAVSREYTERLLHRSVLAHLDLSLNNEH
jgi:hypothetical protein